MATKPDFDSQPKRSGAAYGKYARRHAPSSGFDPKPSPGQSKRIDLDAPTPPASGAAGPGQKSEPLGLASAQKARAKPRQGASRSTPATPSRSGTDKDEETARSKKRKLAKTPPPPREFHPSIYSPPSSPPRSPPSTSIRVKGPDSSALRKPAPPSNPVIRARERTTVSAKSASRGLTTPTATEAPRTTERRIPVGFSSKADPPQSTPRARKSPTKITNTPKPDVSLPPRRKKRLIDALVAQEEDSSEEEDEPSQDVQMTPISNSPGPALSSSPLPPATDQPKPRTFTRQLSMPKKPGPKFTYSQQRSMLADDPLLDSTGLAGLENEPGKAPLLGLASMTKPSALSSFSFVDEEDDTVNSGAVRSLHELRQAGANSRFSDEMDDILDRIGSPSGQPSSLRRGALLELAQKMQEKSFRRQFRNHGADGGLFKSLDQERDLVCGYAILSVLTTLLSTSTSPHIIQQIQSQGIAQLLAQHLEETTDIAVLARERKRNVSKNGQSTLAAIKSAILKLPVWEPLSPSLLSPRTLALKTLDLILRHSTDPDTESAVFSPAVTDHLFSILSDFGNTACWAFPSQPESVDFYLALFLLETHSINAMQSRLGSRWTSQYLPIVADVLETALQRPIDKFDDLESLALRLTLNTTNNNPDAPGMFVRRGILRDLAEAACKTFEAVMKSITDDSFMSKVLDSLVFMLGVQINFCEHYTPAAQSLYEAQDDGSSPLNRLIRMFLDYHSTTSDADSMEKTQLNVAFGYLSTLLGYLCLYPPIRERFISIYAKGTLGPLLESLREFILFYKVAAQGMEGDDAAHSPQASAAERLQTLVNQLESG